MKRLLTLACAAASIIGAVGLLAQTDVGRVRQELEAEYLRADDALQFRDQDRAMNHHTKDFTLRIGKKVLGLDQVAREVHWQLVSTAEVKELSFAVQQVVVNGSTAIATVKQKQTLVVYKRETKYLLSNTQTSDDTWIKTPEGWRLKYQDVKQQSETVDGKEVAPTQ